MGESFKNDFIKIETDQTLKVTGAAMNSIFGGVKASTTGSASLETNAALVSTFSASASAKCAASMDIEYCIKKIKTNTLTQDGSGSKVDSVVSDLNSVATAVETLGNEAESIASELDNCATKAQVTAAVASQIDAAKNEVATQKSEALATLTQVSAQVNDVAANVQALTAAATDVGAASNTVCATLSNVASAMVSTVSSAQRSGAMRTEISTVSSH